MKILRGNNLINTQLFEALSRSETIFDEVLALNQFLFLLSLRFLGFVARIMVITAQLISKYSRSENEGKGNPSLLSA